MVPTEDILAIEVLTILKQKIYKIGLKLNRDKRLLERIHF